MLGEFLLLLMLTVWTRLTTTICAEVAGPFLIINISFASLAYFVVVNLFCVVGYTISFSY